MYPLYTYSLYEYFVRVVVISPSFTFNLDVTLNTCVVRNLKILIFLFVKTHNGSLRLVDHFVSYNVRDTLFKPSNNNSIYMLICYQVVRIRIHKWILFTFTQVCYWTLVYRYRRSSIIDRSLIFFGSIGSCSITCLFNTI